MFFSINTDIQICASLQYIHSADIIHRVSADTELITNVFKASVGTKMSSLMDVSHKKRFLVKLVHKLR